MEKWQEKAAQFLSFSVYFLDALESAFSLIYINAFKFVLSNICFSFSVEQPVMPSQTSFGNPHMIAITKNIRPHY